MKVDFNKDLKQLILDQFRRGRYVFNSNETLEDLVRQYFNNRHRQFDPRRRRVHKSAEISARSLHAPVAQTLHLIEDLAERGEDISSFQSTDLRDPRKIDPLLNDWGIHHLHLDSRRRPGSFFRERTSDLLFVHVQENDLYLIDVLNHDPTDSLANLQLLEIINRNWPGLLRTNGALKGTPGQLTNEQVRIARSKGIIALPVLNDGRVIMPPARGMVSNGWSMEVIMNSDFLLGHIRQMETEVKTNEALIRSEIKTRQGRCPDYLKVRMKSWDQSSVSAQEVKTGLEFKFNLQAEASVPRISQLEVETPG